MISPLAATEIYLSATLSDKYFLSKIFIIYKKYIYIYMANKYLYDPIKSNSFYNFFLFLDKKSDLHASVTLCELPRLFIKLKQYIRFYSLSRFLIDLWGLRNIRACIRKSIERYFEINTILFFYTIDIFIHMVAIVIIKPMKQIFFYYYYLLLRLFRQTFF